MPRLAVVGDKIRSASDEEFLRRHLRDLSILGFIPFDEKIIEADLRGGPPMKAMPALLKVAKTMPGVDGSLRRKTYHRDTADTRANRGNKTQPQRSLCLCG